jgi:hypothetical protein
MEPAALHHDTFLSAGLLSLYTRKGVSSWPSISQYRRLSPSLPHGCTESGMFASRGSLVVRDL